MKESKKLKSILVDEVKYKRFKTAVKFRKSKIKKEIEYLMDVYIKSIEED